MLNIEKFKDILIEMGVLCLSDFAVVNNHPSTCDKNKDCKSCDLQNADSCWDESLKWLFSEYEELEVDWLKVKVDTPILVKNKKEEEWQKRYFAGFKYGKVCAWLSGTTSWIANNEYAVMSWKYAKLAESED